MHNQVISDLQGEGGIGIVKNHFNTVIIIYVSIFNISFPVNLQPADKSSKPSNMKSDFTSTAKDSSLRTKTTFLPLLYVLEVSFPLLLLLPFYAPDEDTGFHF